MQSSLTAHDKILRLFGRFVGAGYVVYIALSIGGIQELAQVTAAWWSIAAVIVIFGSGIGLGVASFLPDVRWIVLFASINAVGYLVIALLWWSAWDGTQMPGQFAVWISAMPGVASLAAAAVWRPPVAFAHMFAAVFIVEAANSAIQEDSPAAEMIPHLVFSWTLCAIFVAAATMAFHTARTLDATIVETHEAAAAAAAAHARTVERERLDALVHDTVLSTLLVAARPRGTTTINVTDQARRAIAGFEELRAGDLAEGDFGPEEVLAHMRSAASVVDEDVDFRAESDPHGEGARYPAPAVRAIGAALAEAMRNSVAHAGPSARRSVTVRLEPARLEVIVADDGVGFDPAAVSDLRLGLAVSIRGRMNAQEGCSAQILSRPGRGARVLLDWALVDGAEC